MIDREKVEQALDAVISSPAPHVDLTALADAAIASVLEQLREPSGEMKVAGADELFESVRECWDDDARAAWQAMLKVAFLQAESSSNPAE